MIHFSPNGGKPHTSSCACIVEIPRQVVHTLTNYILVSNDDAHVVQVYQNGWNRSYQKEKS